MARVFLNPEHVFLNPEQREAIFEHFKQRGLLGGVPRIGVMPQGLSGGMPSGMPGLGLPQGMPGMPVTPPAMPVIQPKIKVPRVKKIRKVRVAR